MVAIVTMTCFQSFNQNLSWMLALLNLCLLCVLMRKKQRNLNYGRSPFLCTWIGKCTNLSLVLIHETIKIFPSENNVSFEVLVKICHASVRLAVQ